MSVTYFKCSNCEEMFLCGTNMSEKTLICGEGCGGQLLELTEEEALQEVKNNYVRFKRDRDYR